MASEFFKTIKELSDAQYHTIMKIQTADIDRCIEQAAFKGRSHVFVKRLSSSFTDYYTRQGFTVSHINSNISSISWRDN